LNAGTRGFEKTKADYTGYNAGSQKQANLSSALDKAVVYCPAPVQVNQVERPPSSYTIAGRETKAVKQAFLASNDPITGKSSLETYN
jgi:hypothetical protein